MSNDLNNQGDNNVVNQNGQVMPVPVPLDRVVRQTPSGMPPITPVAIPNAAPPVVQDIPMAQDATPMPVKKGGKGGILLLILLLLAVAGVGAYFVLFKTDDKDKKQNTNTNANTNTNSNTNNGRPDWDPATSKITELRDPNAIRLVCSQEFTEDNIREFTIITAILIDDVLYQLIVDEGIDFSDDTIQFYDYMAGLFQEQLAEIEGQYENVVSEVRKKAKGISLVLAIDMQADASNPLNEFEYDFIHRVMNYEQILREAETAGYTCQ